MITALLCPECGAPLPGEALEGDTICEYCLTPLFIERPTPAPQHIPQPVEIPWMPQPATPQPKPWMPGTTHPIPYTPSVPTVKPWGEYTDNTDWYYTKSHDGTSEVTEYWQVTNKLTGTAYMQNMAPVDDGISLPEDWTPKKRVSTYVSM